MESRFPTNSALHRIRRKNIPVEFDLRLVDEFTLSYQNPVQNVRFCGHFQDTVK